MNPVFKGKLADFAVGMLAILAGSVVVYFGDKLLGVTLEFYFGVATFSPVWVLDLFFVPFVAGIVVSLIYGFGGKILAHLSPLIVRVWSFYEYNYVSTPPEGMFLLPMSYWLLVLVLSVEFAAIGGVIGEILVKKTYGRTKDKSLLHKKYNKDIEKSLASNDPPDR